MDKPQPPSQTQDKFILRLPDGMRERIKQEGDSRGTSMNAEVIRRLEWSFEQDHAAAYQAYLDAIAKMRSIMDQLRQLTDESRDLQHAQQRKVKQWKRPSWAADSASIDEIMVELRTMATALTQQRQAISDSLPELRERVIALRTKPPGDNALTSEMNQASRRKR